MYVHVNYYGLITKTKCSGCIFLITKFSIWADESLGTELPGRVPVFFRDKNRVQVWEDGRTLAMNKLNTYVCTWIIYIYFWWKDWRGWEHTFGNL